MENPIRCVGLLAGYYEDCTGIMMSTVNE